MSNLDKYLAMKRAQQVTTVNPVMIAPSPMDRYGLRSPQQPAAPLPTYPGPMRPGMPGAGAMQRLGNTGPGPDGVVQPNRPVAMVNAGQAGYEGGRQGQQMVHEGEDISRGPNGDIRVTPATQSQMRPGEQPVTPPGAMQAVMTPQDQARMAMIEKKANMPGMAGGTNPPVSAVIAPPPLPPAASNDGATGSATGEDPQAAERAYKLQRNDLAQQGIGITDSGIQYNLDGSSVGTGGGNKTAGGYSQRRTESIAFTPTAFTDEGLGGGTDRPVATLPAFQPTEIPVVPEVTEAPVPTSADGSTVYSPSKIDQAILNYYQPRLAASQNAERAAEAQALQQQGASAETMQGQQAVSDVSRRSAMGEMVGQFGTKALEGEAARLDNANDQRLAERAMGLNEQQYADTAYTRMATDIANGMSFEDAQTKYGKDVVPDRAAYDRINVTAGTQRRAAASAALGSYADQQAAADPTYVSSGAWKSDRMMTNRLADSWAAEGMEGTFDPNNVAHAAWANSQLSSLTMTPEQVAINRTRSSSWYTNLDDDEKKEVDDLLEFAMMTSVTGGYQMGENSDGSMFLMDSSGEVISGTRQAGGTGGTGGSSVTSSQAADFVTYLSDNGVDTTTLRARQYLLDHPGEPNPSAEQFNAWNSSTADKQAVMKYLNGEATAPLRSVDQRFLSDVISAQAAVQNGTASAEQTALANSVPQKIVNFAWGTTANHTSGDVRFHESMMGELHRSITANDDIYFTLGTKQGALFSEEVTKWATDNAGKVVMIDGRPFLLSAAQPIVKKTEDKSVVSGSDTFTQTFTFDALNLIDLADNTVVKWVGGATGNLWD